MAISYAKDIETLRFFIEKAKKLEESAYKKYLEDNNWHFSVQISARKGEDVQVRKRLPDQTAIDAFVLTLRHFYQDNERVSLRNMAKVYETIPVSSELKNEFNFVRNRLNDFLDNQKSTVNERTNK